MEEDGWSREVMRGGKMEGAEEGKEGTDEGGQRGGKIREGRGVEGNRAVKAK